MKQKNFYYSIIFILLIFNLTSCLKKIEEPSQKRNSEFGIAVHGGAGYMLPDWYTKEQQDEYKTKLTEALKAGYSILKSGGTSIDAVEKAINILENSPLFNAGKGAVFTAEGKNELDASIMDGSNLNCGAVTGITTVKNPISLAHLVMIKSKHVFLSGKGAEKFAEKCGLKSVPTEYFKTEGSLKALEREKRKEKMGTVGCVALDKHGNLAAGTSTGGMTNKKYGRIGDSPIIGAGTYANNKTCAVSATGHGEFFIRNVVTYDISALIEYKNLTLANAANKVVNEKLVKAKGDGGVIAIDKYGNIAMPFNTPGMFRGFILDDGKVVVKIFKK